MAFPSIPQAASLKTNSKTLPSTANSSISAGQRQDQDAMQIDQPEGTQDRNIIRKIQDGIEIATRALVNAKKGIERSKYHLNHINNVIENALQQITKAGIKPREVSEHSQDRFGFVMAAGRVNWERNEEGDVIMMDS